jgi:hypothetical protein
MALARGPRQHMGAPIARHLQPSVGTNGCKTAAAAHARANASAGGRRRQHLGHRPPLQLLDVLADGGADVAQLVTRAGSSRVHLLLARDSAHIPCLRLPKHRGPPRPAQQTPNGALHVSDARGGN